jgi:hypothetical protein
MVEAPACGTAEQASLDALFRGTPPLVTFEQVREWLAEVEAGRWSWTRNTRCKYVDIKLDTRRGAYAVHDRDDKPITYEQLRWQYGREDKP